MGTAREEARMNTPMRGERSLAIALLAAVLLSACGEHRNGRPAKRQPGAVAAASSSQREFAAFHGVRATFENDLGMRFLIVPVSLPSEVGDEGGSPRDEVASGSRQRLLYMQDSEVTNAQYAAFGPRSIPPQSVALAAKWDWLDGDELPVVFVSPQDARDFCNWLSKRDARYSYRLPTPDEWAAACRAGASTRYHFGDTVDETQANFRSGSSSGPRQPAGPKAVRSYAANAWGFHDFHGNVAEWCEGTVQVTPRIRDQAARGGSCKFVSLSADLRLPRRGTRGGDAASWFPRRGGAKE